MVVESTSAGTVIVVLLLLILGTIAAVYAAKKYRHVFTRVIGNKQHGKEDVKNVENSQDTTIQARRRKLESGEGDDIKLPQVLKNMTLPAITPQSHPAGHQADSTAPVADIAAPIPVKKKKLKPVGSVNTQPPMKPVIAEGQGNHGDGTQGDYKEAKPKNGALPGTQPQLEPVKGHQTHGSAPPLAPIPVGVKKKMPKPGGMEDMQPYSVPLKKELRNKPDTAKLKDSAFSEIQPRLEPVNRGQIVSSAPPLNSTDPVLVLVKKKKPKPGEISNTVKREQQGALGGDTQGNRDKIAIKEEPLPRILFLHGKDEAQ